MRKYLPLALTAVLLTGCAVGPDYQRPAERLPNAWPVQVAQAMTGKELAQWWTRFQDPELDRLVNQALVNNLDVAIAVARISEARARLGYTEAQQYPRLDAQVDAFRNDLGRSGESRGPASSYRVLGVLSYEADLWGRLARSTEAARAELLQVSYTAEAVRLALVTDLVMGYLDLRALQRQVRTTEATIEARQQALTLEQSRFRNGAVPEFTLRRTEAELARAEAQLPMLAGEAAQRARTVALLAGLPASQVIEPPAFKPVELAELGVIGDLPRFLPSELLERRPDIRAAEAGLVAANAEIGVARAAWFPSLNLTAVGGSGALDASDLFSGPAALWELGGSVLAPIFDAGRIRAQVQGAEASREVAELQYRATIRQAFREVGDSWTLLETANARLQAVNRETEALEASVGFAEQRYASGHSSFIELLDARRALFEVQLAQTEAMRDRLSASTQLFKALGGGWEEEGMAAAPLSQPVNQNDS
jgi:multidrug efflux system outer membrane protein